MWCRFRTIIALVTFGVASSIVCYHEALAVRSRDYSPGEFRRILHGFGYNITPGDTLNDEASRKAIRELQQGYKLASVDGTANAQTQDFIADVVRVLQGNLNLVLKLNPPLPRTQFYGPRTEVAVRQYQKQYNLPETGIADLALRQRLDAEAKRILGTENSPTQPTSNPTPQPSISPTPRATVTPKPRQNLAPRPKATVSPNPRPRGAVSPSPKPSAVPMSAPSPSP